MRYNLLTLLVALSFATCFTVALNAANIEPDDADSDDTLDLDDNCPDVFNYQQGDTDGDGYGNACDGDMYISDHDTLDDLDANGKVILTDFVVFKAAYDTEEGEDEEYDEQCDMDCDGKVSLDDFTLFKADYEDYLSGGLPDADWSCVNDDSCTEQEACVTPEGFIQVTVESGHGIMAGTSKDVPTKMWIPDTWVGRLSYDICKIAFGYDQTSDLSIIGCDGTDVSCTSALGSDLPPDWTCGCTRSGSVGSYHWFYTLQNDNAIGEDCIDPMTDFFKFEPLLDITWRMASTATGYGTVDEYATGEGMWSDGESPDYTPSSLPNRDIQANTVTIEVAPNP